VPVWTTIAKEGANSATSLAIQGGLAAASRALNEGRGHQEHVHHEVFVGNLDPSLDAYLVTVPMLRNFFAEKLRQVIGVQLGIARTYGFVRLQDKAAATRALSVSS
jgi:hypothetical protein